LLGWNDLPSRLHIGVRRDSRNRFQAHAWVESETRIVVGGHAGSAYTPLLVLEQQEL
jgi:hypothetical protein